MADLDSFVAETRTFNAELERLLTTVPSAETVPVDESRLARREGRGWLPPPVLLEQARVTSIDGRGGPIGLRILSPEGPMAGVYMHIHGGGWALGTADQNDPGFWRLATTAGVAVVSVEYRLAPEHPYPAAVDDCEDAAAWLLVHARDAFGSERVVIGGESAGAHLAVLALLRLRDGHGLDVRQAVAGMNLVYGAYDLSLTPSARRWGERNLVLSTPLIRWFTDLFLPGRDAEARRHPDVSPLYADLAGLPPARFSVGGLDPLVDDTLFMHARWRAAGNPAELDVYPESVHAFNAFPTQMARAANQAQDAFVAKAVRA